MCCFIPELNSRNVGIPTLFLVGISLIFLTGCTPQQSDIYSSDGSNSSITLPALLKADTNGVIQKEKRTQKVSLPSSGRRLKIGKVVETALEENLETKVFRARQREAAAGIDVERGVFDPEFSGELSTGTNQFSNGGHGYEVNKRFMSGAQLRLEGGSQFDEDLPIQDEFGSSSSSDLGLRLRQPLLRGAGEKYNQSGIERAKLVAVASDIRTQAQIYQILRQVESSYWAASTYQELVMVRLNSVSRNRSLLEDIEARKKLGTATKIDVLEAEASLAEAKSELVAARKLYRDEMDNIQVLLGMDLTGGHMDWEMDQVTRAFDNKRSPSVAEVYENAIVNAPSVALLINEVEQREIEAFRASREKLPRLDLEVDSVRRDETGDPWEAIGLVRVSIPWGNREREALYEQAQARLEESKLSREDEQLKLKQQIFEVTRRITSGKEELAVAQQSLEVNEAKWNEQSARAKEGLVSTRALRESEAELRDAEVNESQARLRLILAWSYLTQLDGSIAERLGIEVAVH